jgi:cytochrome c peroxidase
MRWIAIAVLVCFPAFSVAEPFKVRRPLGLIEPDLPINQPLTKEAVELGKRLFFDARLSASGHTSCATCHDPAYGYADPRPVSIGDSGIVQKRNAPSLYNVGYLPTVMWDGRIRTLESQMFDTFHKNGDMGQEIEDAVGTVRKDRDYLELFRSAFNAPPTADLMASALAAFQRTLVSGDSRFDQYLFANDENALTQQEKAGLEVFSTKAGCLNCHDVFHPRFNALGGGLALFTDFRFHNLGVGYRSGRYRDAGRYLWSRDNLEWGAFRTPTLRNLTLTGPYMHDGSIDTLEKVVDFYDRGGIDNPNLSPSIHPLYLSVSEKQALVAYLRTLTDPKAAELAAVARPQPRPTNP